MFYYYYYYFLFHCVYLSIYLSYCISLFILVFSRLIQPAIKTASFLFFLSVRSTLFFHSSRTILVTAFLACLLCLFAWHTSQQTKSTLSIFSLRLYSLSFFFLSHASSLYLSVSIVWEFVSFGITYNRHLKNTKKAQSEEHACPGSEASQWKYLKK